MQKVPSVPEIDSTVRMPMSDVEIGRQSHTACGTDDRNTRQAM